MSVKLAYSSNAYMRHSVFEAVDRIAALGYSGIELMADVPHLWPADATPQTLNAIRTRLTERGLTISNVNAFMMNAVQDFWHPSWIEPDPAFRRLRVDHTIAALRMAAQLGAPSITTEPGGPLIPELPYEAAMDLFVHGLREALLVAEQEGVSLLVEPEPGLLVENVTQFLDLASRIQSPAFGLNFDAGHFYCVSEPLPDALRSLRSWIRHVHVEDIAASRIHEHLVPGRGVIDFPEFFRSLGEIGFSGWVTVELYPYLDDPDGAGREALSFLQPLADS